MKRVVQTAATTLLAVVLVFTLGCNTVDIVTALNAATAAAATAAAVVNSSAFAGATWQKPAATSLSVISVACSRASKDESAGTLSAAEIAAISAQLLWAVASMPQGNLHPDVDLVLIAADAAATTLAEILQAQPPAVSASAKMPGSAPATGISKADARRFLDAAKALQAATDRLQVKH